MWTLLPHTGNSDTAQRIALLARYLSLFEASSIRVLLADREFIGADWLEFLCKNNIPFVIRLREDMQIRLADGRLHQFRSLLRKHRCGKWTGWLNGMDTIPANQLRVAAKRIKGSELLIVATNLGEGVSGLNLYRKRWGIECLFADAKTRGLNIEDTHITDPDKLANLLIVVALAVTWAHRCATLAMGRKAIRIKAHGRREKSWFRTGLDALRNWIIHRPDRARCHDRHISGQAADRMCPLVGPCIDYRGLGGQYNFGKFPRERGQGSDDVSNLGCTNRALVGI